MDKTSIDIAKEHFGDLLGYQLAKVESMKVQGDFVDYTALDKIIIGVCGGDGIGPAITYQSERILKYLLKEEIEAGKVEFLDIDGLTIERRVEEMAAIPKDVLTKLKKCHVILKGPTTRPKKGMSGRTLRVLTLRCARS